jgi:hypothetical protein
LRDGSIERVAVDTTEPSAFARGILNSELYTFLDDAPLEERRTQAVLSRRTLDARSMDDLGALGPAAVRRVREEAWPQPESAEDVHDALVWLGFVTDEEARCVDAVAHGAGGPEPRRAHATRWYAVDGPSEPKSICSVASKALGPVFEDDPRIALHQGKKRRCCSSWSTTARSSARAWTESPRGASGDCWRESTATRSMRCGARSSPSRRPSSCSSSRAGSTPILTISWKVRAAWLRCLRSSPARRAGMGMGIARARAPRARLQARVAR